MTCVTIFGYQKKTEDKTRSAHSNQHYVIYTSGEAEITNMVWHCLETAPTLISNPQDTGCRSVVCAIAHSAIRERRDLIVQKMLNCAKHVQMNDERQVLPHTDKFWEIMNMIRTIWKDWRCFFYFSSNQNHATNHIFTRCLKENCYLFKTNDVSFQTSPITFQTFHENVIRSMILNSGRPEKIQLFSKHGAEKKKSQSSDLMFKWSNAAFMSIINSRYTRGMAY